MKKMNWNTAILTAGFAILGFFGRETVKDVKLAHDDILVVKTDMVHRQEFEVQITDLKVRVANVEVQIERMKKDRN